MFHLHQFRSPSLDSKSLEQARHAAYMLTLLGMFVIALIASIGR